MTIKHQCENEDGIIVHDWGHSKDVIGLVGELYPSIYPLACRRCKTLWRSERNKIPEFARDEL